MNFVIAGIVANHVNRRAGEAGDQHLLAEIAGAPGINASGFMYAHLYWSVRVEGRFRFSRSRLLIVGRGRG